MITDRYGNHGDRINTHLYKFTLYFSLKIAPWFIIQWVWESWYGWKKKAVWCYEKSLRSLIGRMSSKSYTGKIHEALQGSKTIRRKMWFIPLKLLIKFGRVSVNEILKDYGKRPSWCLTEAKISLMKINQVMRRILLRHISKRKS